MKKANLSTLIILSMLLMFFVTLKSYSENYTISFTGTGASTSVESVTVQNLTQGTTVTVPAGNVLTLAVTIPNAIDQLSANNEGIKIYPNPMQGKSTVLFYVKQTGSTLIKVFGIDGKQLVENNKNLQEGENTFLLSLPKGVYAIQVVGKGYSYTSKVISQSNIENKPEISFTENEKPVSSALQKIKSAITAMPFIEGDRLLFKGISGNYSTIVTDIPTQSKTVTFSFVDCTDADGNHYPVVQIGIQIWMTENLKTTKYNNGDPINNVTDNSAWSKLLTGAWSNYDNDIATGNKYGKLYNWYTVKSNNFAPLGWHVPTDSEWDALRMYLKANITMSSSIAKALTATTDWDSSIQLGAIGNDLTKNNSYGYQAFPSGIRNYNGIFDNFGSSSYWWSSTENDSNSAWNKYLFSDSNDLIYRSNDNKKNGFSIRCVKDYTHELPAIITKEAKGTSISTGSCGGNITANGGEPILASGVCWKTSSNPTIADSKTIDDNYYGDFTSLISGLKPNTEYYVKAYATSNLGTVYGDEVSFTTAIGVTDIDGNVYNTITIGTQVWMVENLRTTKYRDGTTIPLVPDNSAWAGLSTPAYCWYNNDSTTNRNTYGALYNWYTVNSGKLAPVGWHVPTYAEWTSLQSYVGEDLTKSGFSALLGGYRYDYYGTFDLMGSAGFWWSSDESWSSYRYYSDNDIRIGSGDDSDGLSVRCLKNNVLGTIPTLSTTNVSSINSFSAICEDSITSDGLTTITARGICWNTTGNPTLSDNKTTNGYGMGSFKTYITGLSANTTYYVRAFATNIVGTGYGVVQSFKTLPESGVTVTDIDGNVYHGITIGTQVWMVENLNTTKYRNGESIGTTTPANKDITNESAPHYQWAYNGDESNASKYGRLYTWYAVNDSRNLAPTGWHVASDAEWTTLETYLIANGYNYDGTTSGNKIAKSLAATTDWNLYFETGVIGNDLTKNNTSGFTALPGGLRGYDGTFNNIGYFGYWWSSTKDNTTYAWLRGLSYDYDYLYRVTISKSYGFSVRCVRN